MDGFSSSAALAILSPPLINVIPAVVAVVRNDRRLMSLIADKEVTELQVLTTDGINAPHERTATARYVRRRIVLVGAMILSIDLTITQKPEYVTLCVTALLQSMSHETSFDAHCLQISEVPRHKEKRRDSSLIE